jgi:hypothetical protein
LSRDGLLLIQVFLEHNEHLADLIRSAESGDSVGNGVVVFQAEQRRWFFLVEFFQRDYWYRFFFRWRSLVSALFRRKKS